MTLHRRRRPRCPHCGAHQTKEDYWPTFWDGAAYHVYYYCPACGWSEQAEEEARWQQHLREQGITEKEQPDYTCIDDEGDPPF